MRTPGHEQHLEKKGKGRSEWDSGDSDPFVHIKMTWILYWGPGPEAMRVNQRKRLVLGSLRWLIGGRN